MADKLGQKLEGQKRRQRELMGPLGAHGAPGHSPPLYSHSQLLCCHTEDDEQVQEPESLWGQGWHREGSAGSSPHQSIPSTAPSRPYVEGDSQGQQPGREDTEDPIEVVEEAAVQPAVGVAPDEVAPLGAVVLPNLPALRGRGEGAWPGPPSTHRPPRGMPQPPRGVIAHPEPPLPPQGLARGCFWQVTVTPASVSPPVCATRAWVEGCGRASRGGSPCPHPILVPTQPTPTPGRGKAPAWQAARFSEEKTSSGGNPGEIPAAMAGTWKQGRDGTGPHHPSSAQIPPGVPPKPHRSPQTYIQAPSVAQSIPPGRERVSHVQQQRGPGWQSPGQAEHPGQPRGPLPHGPLPRGDTYHRRRSPGTESGGCPRTPIPRSPGGARRGLKINNKIGNYNEC